MQRVSVSSILSALQQDCASFLRDSSYTPVPIPAHFSEMKGTLRGEYITLNTRRFLGYHYRSITMAWIVRDSDGSVCSLTVIGLPTQDSGAPILGVDLIGLGGSLSLVAIDLAPTDDATYSERSMPRLRSLHSMTDDSVVHRKRPEFCQDTFSPLALICAGKPGHEAQLQSACATFLSMELDARKQTSPFVVLPAERADSAASKQRAWLLSERKNRKEAKYMSLMFGEDLAADYLYNFLFEVPSV